MTETVLRLSSVVRLSTKRMYEAVQEGKMRCKGFSGGPSGAGSLRDWVFPEACTGKLIATSSRVILAQPSENASIVFARAIGLHAWEGRDE